MKDINLRTILAISLAALPLVTSCVKEEKDYYHYTFDIEGGVKEYVLNLDGDTLSLIADGEQASKAIYFEDTTSNTSQWFTEKDWIRVYYTPYSKLLLISVDKNISGHQKNAKITGSSGDEAVNISISQK